MEEQWRDVSRGSGNYEVSNLGRVRRGCRTFVLKSGRERFTPSRLLRTGKNADGYRVANIYINGKSKSEYVHQLVAEAFLGKQPEGTQVAHDDGNKDNNAVSNLAYKTRLQNAADKKLHGSTLAGSRHHFAKLDEREVAVIKRKIAQGFTLSGLARLYRVTPAVIRSIAHGRTWRHVP